ncbi:MAG: hypothetical protein RLP09_07905 [Sandaracinaceae bacterium]|nr:hypothetical protein [Myxococcales bacterium]
MACLDTLMAEHLRPLFSGFRTADDEDQAGDEITALVGFTGDGGLGGCIVIRGDKGAFMDSAPFLGVDVLDWAAELANLAAGRVKYGLFSGRRWTIKQTTPVVMRGAIVEPRRIPEMRDFALTGPNGTLRVWVELRGTEDAAEHMETPQEEGDAMGAGEMLLF